VPNNRERLNKLVFLHDGILHSHKNRLQKQKYFKIYEVEMSTAKKKKKKKSVD
jgi:hypothetical protein